MNEIRAQFAQVWGQIGAWQRMSLIGVVLAAVVGFGWLVFSTTQPDWRVLYSDLDEATASKVVEELKSRQIPYQLDASKISVPQEHLYEARLGIAGSGIADATAAGYELFDESDFGMTQFTQNVNYRRAMENELARTIGHLETVRDARVHLVLPEESLFRDEQKPPSASVVLRLAGMTPRPEQVQAMQHLVASAVEGMSPSNVTIVDQQGRLLAKPDGSAGAMGESANGGNNSMEQASAMERELETRVVELLAPLVGLERVRAKVRVELDTTKVTETSEEFDPEKTAVRSEQRTESNSSDGAVAAAGPPGIGSNLPGRGGQGNPTQSNSASTSEVTNYEVSKTVRQVTQEGFSVSRVSVAVLLDETGLKAEDGTMPVDAAKIESLVKNAVGFSAERGDSVEVSMEPFRAEMLAAAGDAAWWQGPDLVVPALRYATLAFMALLLFFFVGRPLARTMKEMNKLAAANAQAVATGQANRLDAEVVGRRVGDLDSEVIDSVGISGQSAYPGLRSEVIELSTGDLDKTANIVRQWIRSDAEA